MGKVRTKVVKYISQPYPMDHILLSLIRLSNKNLAILTNH